MSTNPSEEVAPLLLNSGPVVASQPYSPYPTPDYINSAYGAPYPPQPQNYATNIPFNTAPPPTALPPVYNVPIPNAQGMLEVPCRVCSRPIQYAAARNLSAVRCEGCSHTTQVGPPPRGKTFILCQCNTLLSVPVTAKAATCPKQDCKRTLILKPEDPGKSRAFCSHCNTLLSYSNRSAVVICPKCRGRSVVSRSKLHWYIGFNIFLGLTCISLGLIFTVTSFELASGGGVYFVFWGLLVVGILALIRAIVYSSLNWRARDAVYVPV